MTEDQQTDGKDAALGCGCFAVVLVAGLVGFLGDCDGSSCNDELRSDGVVLADSDVAKDHAGKKALREARYQVLRALDRGDMIARQVVQDREDFDGLLKQANDAVSSKHLLEASSLLDRMRLARPNSKQIPPFKEKLAVAREQEVLDKSKSLFEKAKALEKKKDYVQAAVGYEASLAVIKQAELQKLQSKARSLKRKVERRRDRNSGRATKQLAKLTMCGAEPPSATGAMSAIRAHVRSTAHDPNSIQDLRCNPPKGTPKKCWKVSCSFRGRNVFGALVLNHADFYVGSRPGNHAEVLGVEVDM